MKFLLVLGRAYFVGLLILLLVLLGGGAVLGLWLPQLLHRALSQSEKLLGLGVEVALIFAAGYFLTARLITIRPARDDEAIELDLTDR
jgi:hypothetical protein